MRLRTLVRSSSATALLPLLVGFVLLVLGDNITAWVTPGYWTSATGSAAFALPFVAAACAACAAWEASRLSKARVFDQTPVRGPLSVTLTLLLPVLATGLLALMAALIIAAIAADVPFGLPQPGILAAAASVLLANALVGSVIGRIMPGVLAAPLALVGSFVANAYPASWSAFWPRHLVGGGLSNCCSIDTSVNVKALLGTIVFTTGVSGAALVLVRFRGRTTPLTVTAACVASGVALAWPLVRDIGPEPVQDRAVSELVCQDAGLYQVCLWPEIENTSHVRKNVRAAAEKLENIGVSVPRTLTMAARPENGDTKLGIDPAAGPEDIPLGIARGLLPEIPACAVEGHPYPAGAAAAAMEAWLEVGAGAPLSTVGSHLDPQTAGLLNQLYAQPRQEQLAWYEHNRQAMSACGTEPKLNIAEGRP
ncbi:hypothetical protein [Streptomyces sp. NPDC008265]|uniref:DUF7224 domain-containing protein n=1 Tax=Streptomyces sp. NPDC008265 TaxID=3364824 RepID=UPI0036E68D9E